MQLASRPWSRCYVINKTATLASGSGDAVFVTGVSELGADIFDGGDDHTDRQRESNSFFVEEEMKNFK